MSQFTRRLLFILFFSSGFSGLVYQVVWVRLAFASFGIITPVISVVVSVFMLGLSVGAWAGGQSIQILVRKTGWSALWFYAATELMIAVGAFAVPQLFALGEQLLLSTGAMDSARYLFFSALVLALSMLPWCIFMGATFPFMMAFVREEEKQNAESFSFLYLANVLGAMGGSLLSAFVLVELLGLRRTLWVAAASNLCVAFIAAMLARSGRSQPTAAANERRTSTKVRPMDRKHGRGRLVLSLLFLTGFTALGMEVIWARAFTPVLETQVYSFALIVSTYLGATFLGSAIYRVDLRRNSVRSMAVLLSIASVGGFLPIVLNDLRLLISSEDTVARWSGAVVLLSICPFCAALGYLTPSLIDKYALGDPAQAGRAYALNVFGCILGPLVASYLSLPSLGERIALSVLAAPYLLFFLLAANSLSNRYRWATVAISVAVAIWSVAYSVDFARFISRNFENTEVRRDYAASVVSTGRGRDKQLFVNGVGMTALVPAAKLMAHLPLGLRSHPAESALIICFGMGTSYRSALSWDVQTTAVELVPSVKEAFAFYYDDAPQVLRNPKGQIVVDDGRRYLARIREKFDAIVVDPPPPVEAAGSSLLYSEEFCVLAKAHLKPNGIMAAWFPGGDRLSAQAILRSLVNSFSSVRCFVSNQGWGLHILVSSDPIPNLSAQQFAARMPAAAHKDALEWAASHDLTAYVDQVLSKEIPVERALNPDPRIRITDDHPYNEYFLLRRWRLR